MQRLLIVGRLRDPENMVVLFSIDTPNMPLFSLAIMKSLSL